MTSKFQRKLLDMHMRIEGHLLPGGKEDLKSFTSSGYRDLHALILFKSHAFESWIGG